MSDPAPPFDELPEVMLSLRSLGSHRRGSLETEAVAEEQERFFAPLLEARRHAAAATTIIQVVAAFDAAQLLARLDETMRSFAATRFDTRPPARRAFEAELFEIVEALHRSLQRLAAEAERIGAAPAAAGQHWPSWLAALRETYRIADSTWAPLRDALSAPVPPPAAPPGPWRAWKKER